MARSIEDFSFYIEHLARPGKNKARAECLLWLRDQLLMGMMPHIPVRGAWKVWRELYQIMPAIHRPSAGKLWKEYMAYRLVRKCRMARELSRKRFATNLRA